jgi:hypothetical protein
MFAGCMTYLGMYTYLVVWQDNEAFLAYSFRARLSYEYFVQYPRLRLNIL